MKWALRLGGAGCGALLLAGLLAAVEARRGRGALDSRLAQLRASGESLDVERCRPPAVPAASNAWLGVRTWTNQLAGKPGVLLRERDDHGRPRVWRGAEEGRGEGGGGDDWNRLRAEVGERAEALAAVMDALKRPDYDTGFGYTNGFFDLPQDTTHSLHLGMWLGARAGVAVRDGRRREAVEATLSLLRLVLHQRRQPLIIAQFVRVSHFSRACTLTGRLLDELDLDWADLQALQRAWELPDPLADMESAFRLERAVALDHFRLVTDRRDLQDRMFESELEVHEVLGEEPPPVWRRWTRRNVHSPLWRMAWVDWDKAFQLDRWNRLLAVLREGTASSWHAVRDRALAMDTALGGPDLDPADDVDPPGSWVRLRGFLSFGGKSLTTDSRFVESAFRSETWRRLSMASVAIHRFRAKEGRLPRGWAEMVPNYLAAVPGDPMDGKALRYRTDGDGATLYSVGGDGVDDGGDSRTRPGSPRTVYESRDWVFPGTFTRPRGAGALER